MRFSLSLEEISLVRKNLRVRQLRLPKSEMTSPEKHRQFYNILKNL